MSDLIHGNGIFRCQGCGHIYPEYVNGCVKHDDGERKVTLVIGEVDESMMIRWIVVAEENTATGRHRYRVVTVPHENLLATEAWDSPYRSRRKAERIARRMNRRRSWIEL